MKKTHSSDKETEFWNASLAMKYMWDSKMKLDKTEPQNSVEEVKVFSSIPFMKTV